jgi:hypothetical protein
MKLINILKEHDHNRLDEIKKIELLCKECYSLIWNSDQYDKVVQEKIPEIKILLTNIEQKLNQHIENRLNDRKK